MTRFRALILLPLLALLSALTGCVAGSDSSATDPSSTKSGVGTINVATVTGVLPYESFDTDGKTLIGFEPELLNEAAKRIGAKPVYTVSGFDSLLLGLDSKRFDLVMGGMVDNAEREKSYDALNVTNDQFTWVAKKDLAEQTKSFDDMCGKKIGLLAGSSYEAATKDAAEKCEAEGKPMTLLNFDEDAQGRLAVTSGQIDYYPSNLPLLAQFVKANPEFALVGFSFLPGPTAMYLQKGSPLTQKLQEALQSMVDDGTYQTILDKWDVGDIAIPEIKVNPVTG